MFEKNRAWIGVLALIFVLVLFVVPSRLEFHLKSVVRSVTLPAEGTISGLRYRISDAIDALRGLGGMLETNLDLSEEVVRLQAERRAFESLERENRILRDQLTFYREGSFEMIPCEVVSRGISGWWKTIRVSKGSRYGVEVDRAVVSPDGLIGKTVEVNPFSSEVLLLSDPSCKLSARISRSGSFGIVYGGGLDLRGNPICQMEFINKDVPIRVGDEVVTSGLGGVFPEGILIGYIESVRKDELGLYQEAMIIPKADLSIIEYVFAVTEGASSDSSELIIEEEFFEDDRVLSEEAVPEL